jgi:hypothetical protein
VRSLRAPFGPGQTRDTRGDGLHPEKSRDLSNFSTLKYVGLRASRGYLLIDEEVILSE